MWQRDKFAAHVYTFIWFSLQLGGWLGSDKNVVQPPVFIAFQPKCKKCLRDCLNRRMGGGCKSRQLSHVFNTPDHSPEQGDTGAQGCTHVNHVAKIKQHVTFGGRYCCHLWPIQVYRAMLQPHVMHTAAAQWVNIVMVKTGCEKVTYCLLSACQTPFEKWSTANHVSGAILIATQTLRAFSAPFLPQSPPRAL